MCLCQVIVGNLTVNPSAAVSLLAESLALCLLHGVLQKLLLLLLHMHLFVVKGISNHCSGKSSVSQRAAGGTRQVGCFPSLLLRILGKDNIYGMQHAARKKTSLPSGTLLEVSVVLMSFQVTMEGKAVF